MRKKRLIFVLWLNASITPEYDSDEWIIGGKHRFKRYFGRYGVALRRFDPIAFEVGFQDWNRKN